MMKKNFFALTILAAAFGLASCNPDDPTGGKTPAAANLDYSSENATAWHNYMTQVASLLKDDAATLYAAWSESYEGGAAYAESFKNHTWSSDKKAVAGIEQIIDGCITIADEVGNAKIGDPYNLYISGNTTEALYAVESWYSWHSRDDYTNNIWSIRKAYYGSTDGEAHPHSVSAAIAAVNNALDTKVKAAIQATADAIQAIPQPFRNNINSDEARAAMAACAALVEVMENELMPVVTAGTIDEDTWNAVVTQYVDHVVMPTYLALKEKNETLYNTVKELAATPSNEAFEAACNAWLEAREPWEMSEAFLFGPVDALGLDPNLDSWPLDQDAIVQILTSSDWGALEWTEDSEAEAAQSVRGFHTLEYLLFKDGKPRRVK